MKTLHITKPAFDGSRFAVVATGNDFSVVRLQGLRRQEVATVEVSDPFVRKEREAALDCAISACEDFRIEHNFAAKNRHGALAALTKFVERISECVLNLCLGTNLA